MVERELGGNVVFDWNLDGRSRGVSPIAVGPDALVGYTSDETGAAVTLGRHDSERNRTAGLSFALSRPAGESPFRNGFPLRTTASSHAPANNEVPIASMTRNRVERLVDDDSVGG